MLLALLVSCGSVGLESWEQEAGPGRLDIDPKGRVEFPDTSPDGHSVESEVSVLNEGGSAAVIDDVWVEGAESGAFFLEGVRVPTQVQPGGTYTFTAHFLPEESGLHEGTLVVLTAEGAYLERLLMGSGCRDENRDGDC